MAGSSTPIRARARPDRWVPGWTLRRLGAFPRHPPQRVGEGRAGPPTRANEHVGTIEYSCHYNPAMDFVAMRCTFTKLISCSGNLVRQECTTQCWHTELIKEQRSQAVVGDPRGVSANTLRAKSLLEKAKRVRGATTPNALARSREKRE